MNVTAIRVAYEPRRSLAFGGISGTYAAVGTAITYAARIVKITNNTDAGLDISWDGITDHDFLPATTSMVLDFGSNASQQGGYLEQPAGSRLYVKGSPSSGSVYLTVIYASSV